MSLFSSIIRFSSISFGLLIAGVTASHGQETQVPVSAEMAQEAEALDRVITHFYQSPNLLHVFTAVEKVVATNQATKTLNFETLAIFFSEIFRRSPESIPATVQHFSQYKNDLNALPWMAAWLANTDEGRATVEKLRAAGYGGVYETITAVPPVDVRSFQPRGQSVVDALWVYFYAAGDVQDLAMVFQIAVFDQKNTAGEFLIADAAQRQQLRDYASGSLVVHAALHPAVLAFLTKAEQSSPESVKAQVSAIKVAALQLVSAMQQPDNKGLGQILEDTATQ